eukprot:CAMPEP_0195263356 /NCGR_PEP_ID=MMETSP0706-20130129/10264_1 /TAXON_ID=33640 /ORGANISM="Asterionellopsis glacialis, Strain CCMP134" /LENGTH=78 /DNA_ID=CAMNT_0040317537 /DNA_START=525 /DNA_END=761 /DNA_ORIENTATION=-
MTCKKLDHQETRIAATIQPNAHNLSEARSSRLLAGAAFDSSDDSLWVDPCADPSNLLYLPGAIVPTRYSFDSILNTPD